MFKTTVTKMSILEMAGWQWSVGWSATKRAQASAHRKAERTAGVRVYLPVLLHGSAPEKDRKENGEPSDDDDDESDVNALLVAETLLRAAVRKSWFYFQPLGRITEQSHTVSRR